MRRRQLLLGALCLTAYTDEPLRVPLVAGLTAVTALHEPGAGDYESVKSLGARIMQPAPGWRIDYRASLPRGAERVQSTRQHSDADLTNTTTYRSRFESDTEEHYPGSTALGVSTAVLRQPQVHSACSSTVGRWTCPCDGPRARWRPAPARRQRCGWPCWMTTLTRWHWPGASAARSSRWCGWTGPGPMQIPLCLPAFVP